MPGLVTRAGVLGLLGGCRAQRFQRRKARPRGRLLEKLHRRRYGEAEGRGAGSEGLGEGMLRGRLEELLQRVD